MINNKLQKERQKHRRNLQELYYDGEAEYIDERYVSLELLQGDEDCVEYLDSKYTYDDEIIRLKNGANKGKFYREPYKLESNAFEKIPNK
ncbi:hypothetical protein SAMN04487895_101729 [Paenibacillus sophorae]|uniref:Uncharacterized protein n=1 Tax=Paenibacillus sophorae TaxID=1333845 RepID=A0A1H8H1I3_9BACL|nr:hypothetical protein [Paenibacillus sophorae]QWU14418.1 hypothetical protein KP014_21150 [Paenibacillus sophorae]SEN50212.1 hypothetical protein SAMN04487895_101729 [Paenibacillus sophorae]